MLFASIFWNIENIRMISTFRREKDCIQFSSILIFHFNIWKVQNQIFCRCVFLVYSKIKAENIRRLLEKKFSCVTAWNYCFIWMGLINSAIVRRPIVLSRKWLAAKCPVETCHFHPILLPVWRSDPVIKAGKQNYLEIWKRAPWPEDRPPNWPIFAVIDHLSYPRYTLLHYAARQKEERATMKLSTN